jgi:hypothetical protein
MNTDMDINRILDENFKLFDFGVAGVLPGFLVADDAHVITPMCRRPGCLWQSTTVKR